MTAARRRAKREVMIKKNAIRKSADGSLPADVEGFDSLAELALDLRSSWNHCTDDVWRQLDPVQWELTHNPWGLLKTVSRDRLAHALSDPGFRRTVDALVQSREHAATVPAWFQHKYRKPALTCAAYFSMEFMLSESLPIYSGGLGNVAGDQLKAASDLGVPVIGVGLLYQQGYFRQAIDKNGAQQALYPYNDPVSCRLLLCAARTANCCDWKSICPVIQSGCGRGRRRWGECDCTSWTATTRQTCPSSAGSRASCMAGAGTAAPAGNPPGNRGLAVACSTRNPAGSLPPE